MNTIETTIKTETIERIGTAALVRTIDFEALKKSAVDGQVDVAALDDGAFVVVVTPTKKNVKPSRIAVASETDGAAFIAGMLHVTALRKNAPRKPKSAAAAKGAKGAAAKGKGK